MRDRKVELQELAQRECKAFGKMRDQGELTPEVAAGFLPDHTRNLAGALANASDLAIEAHISLQPVERRIRLSALGIVDRAPDLETALEAGRATPFKVTAYGSQVLAVASL